MLDEIQARRGDPKVALANGYRPAIGRNLADAVEQFAAEMVAKIRAAAHAKEGK